MHKIDIKSLTIDQIEGFLTEMGESGFRARQIFNWVHNKKVASFSDMSNISKQLREKLCEKFYIYSLKIEKKLVSRIDNTVKYLYKLQDQDFVETVLMEYSYGNSLCISTQAGCKMGCTFCASTKAGFVRNLSVSEMLEQVYLTETQSGKKISNIVLMGIGEPLDNFDNVMKFLGILSHDQGRNFSLRHVTISTCGLVDQIYKLAKYNMQITLSISLHAPNDLKRIKTMPIASKYKIDELLKACKFYADYTKRRVSFEYALIQGINDSKEDSKELAKKLKGIMCHVNLIPINQIKESEYKASSCQSVNDFASNLQKSGINVTIRRTLGQDINASCGQLRRDNYNL